jgi:hypothetical protein
MRSIKCPLVYEVKNKEFRNKCVYHIPSKQSHQNALYFISHVAMTHKNEMSLSLAINEYFHSTKNDILSEMYYIYIVRKCC